MTSLTDLRREFAAARAVVQATTDAAIKAHNLRMWHPDHAAEASECERIAAGQQAALERVRNLRHRIQQMGATP